MHSTSKMPKKCFGRFQKRKVKSGSNWHVTQLFVHVGQNTDDCPIFGYYSSISETMYQKNVTIFYTLGCNNVQDSIQSIQQVRRLYCFRQKVFQNRPDRKKPLQLSYRRKCYMGNGQKSLLPLKHFAASKAICVRPFLTQAYLLTGWCRTLARFFRKE